MTDTPRERMHLTVQGRVQGVCFRAAARDEALRLGLTGWVRNRPDGSVELVAEGDPQALAALRRWCDHGPPMARVTRVAAAYAPATGSHDAFRVAG